MNSFCFRIILKQIASLLIISAAIILSIMSSQVVSRQLAYGRTGWKDMGAADSLTPAQTLKRFQISDLALSPNESYIAMTVTEPVKGSKQRSNIWVFDTGRLAVKRFTTSGKSDSHPRWSLDSKMLAFLSNRAGTTQIYLMPLGGGEAEAKTEGTTPVHSFAWSPDGTKIAFLAADPKTEEEERKQREKGDAFVVDRDVRDARLRFIDIESGQVDFLTPVNLRISEYVWMPGGDQLLLSATDHPRRDLFTNRLHLIALNTKETVKIETPAGRFSHLDISPNGEILAYLGPRTEDGPHHHDLFIRPLEGDHATNLTGSSLDREILWYQRHKDGSFLTLAMTGFTNTFHNITVTGAVERLKPFNVHPGDVYPGRPFIAGSRLLAFVGETTTKAPELWLSVPPGTARQVTHFNREWDAIPLIAPEIVCYPSSDGMEIEAALLKPTGYKEGTQVPFVVIVHGGPAGRFADSFEAWSQLLAARGYAVLLPNIRGSIGYKHDFRISNRYDWGGGDWKDVMAGVDFVIDQGIADPNRLGIGGWSYGGYMAAWAVTQSNRFRASVSGAPITDLASEFGSESPGPNIGDTWALGTPYENLDLFVSRSAVTFIRKVKTPTLLLHGEQDRVDPIGQSQQFYRGLRRYGVETEFVQYPRMGHLPVEENHQLDVLNRMIGWFEKFLK